MITCRSGKRILAVLLSAAVLSGTLFLLPLSAQNAGSVTGIVSPDSRVGAVLTSLTDEEVDERHWNNLAASSGSQEPLKLPIYCSRANIRYTPSSEVNSYTPSRLGNLTDGEVADSRYGNGANYGGGVALQRNPSYANPSSVMPKIQIDLGEAKEISEILISWAADAPVKAYNIYASKTRNFSVSYQWYSDYAGKPEQILSVTGETEETCNRLITLEQPAVYRYIVIEFRQFSDTAQDYAGQSWTGVLLTELGVYAAGEGLPEYTVDEITDASYVAGQHERNLIADVSSVLYGSSADDAALIADGRTDGTYTVTVEDGKKARLVMRLDGISAVDSVLVSFTDRSAAVGYRVFAGISEETLFSGEHYIAYRRYEPGASPTSLVRLADARLAGYVGIQFTSAVSTEQAGRILELLEIAVYGERAEDLDLVTEISAPALVNPEQTAARHGQSLLSDGYSFLSFNSAYKLSYTDAAYPRSPEMLRDGDASSDSFDGSAAGGALQFKGGGDAFRLTVDLGFVPPAVSELLIYGLAGCEIGAYHLYFSDDPEKLFAADNWVGYYDNADGSHAQLIRFATPHTEQFIGIEITDSGSDPTAVYLKEIAVYGARDFSGIPRPVYSYTVQEDIVNQAYITENHPYNLIRYTRSDNTDDSGDSYTKKSFTSEVTDGTVYDNTAFTWWTTADFKVCRATYSLGQTVPIDRILFASNYDSSTNYTTQIYEIYISTSLEDLYSPEHLAVYWNNYGKWRSGGNKYKGITYGASQVFEFPDRPAGRYIGFRIIRPNDTDADNSIRIEQLGVYSNGVLPVDPIYTAVLTDETTGVRVAVRKLEYEDEYNGVQSVSLEPYTVPEETAAAAGSYYLKSTGTAYRVVLKNAAGQALTADDLEGRGVEFTIPYRHSDGDGTLYVCQMNGGEIVRQDAIVLEDTVNFISYSLDPIGFFTDTFGHGLADSAAFAWDPVYELSLKAAENQTADSIPDGAFDSDSFYGDEPTETEGSAGTPSKVAKTVRTKRTVIVRNPSVFTQVWFWAIIAAAVLAAAAVTVLLILKRKKRKNHA